MFAKTKRKNMKRTFYYLICSTCLCLTLYSCEGCVKNTSKTATNIGLDVLEGVTEAISERGDTLGKKILDASGELAKGAGKSISRQLDEHADEVAAVAGSTLIKTMEGLEEGISKEYYTEFVTKEDFCSDVTLNFFGKINDRGVTDAFFTILKEGNYKFAFDFCNDNCNTIVLNKKAEFNKVGTEKENTVISFAFNKEEELTLNTITCVKVSVTRD